MHTQKQATDLWCPMARVSQVGAAETPAAYNRVLSKKHVTQVFSMVRRADEFELGQPEAEDVPVTLLEMTTQLSQSANCIGDKCAMWVWHPSAMLHPNDGRLTMPNGDPAKGRCGLAAQITT